MATMPRFTLVVGNRAYSRWSLRAYLCVKRAAPGTREVQIDLAGAGSAAAYEKVREGARARRRAARRR